MSKRSAPIDTGAYQSVVGEEIPRAAIVYDRFHLHLNLNTAVDEVWRQEWRQAKAEEKAVIKGSRFILLANRENLDGQGSARLKAFQEINENITAASFLKEQVRAVRTDRYPDGAKKALL